MAGFPARITRAALGPKFRNTSEVEDPATDFGAPQFEALCWNTAGMSRVGVLAKFIGAWASTDFNWITREEVWNPDGILAHPVVTRASAGVYAVQFLTTYPDELGVARSVTLTGGRVDARSAAGTFATRISGDAAVDTVNDKKVNVKFWDPAGAAVDPAWFWLEVT